MSSTLEDVIEQCHTALEAIVKGDAEPWGDLFSRRDDVTLGNPFGPFVRGFDGVMSTARAAAARYRDGEIVGFDRVATYETNQLVCVVEVERFRARVGGSHDLAEVCLRVTSVFGFEKGNWRLVHRHADPISAAQPAESVLRSPSV